MALTAVGGDASRLDRVTGQLMAELRSGRWPVGTRIPGENTLCEQLQVSRPLVREAIQGLTRMGMLEPRQGSGTFVRSVSSPAAMLSGIERADVRQIFEVQMAYDVQAAGLAAARRTEDDVARLRELVQARDEAESDRNTPGRFADADARFHLAVVEVARNPLLGELYRYFVGRLRDGLVHVHADPAIPECGPESHHAIVAAIADQDVAAAREAAYRVVAMSLAPFGDEGDSLADSSASRR